MRPLWRVSSTVPVVRGVGDVWERIGKALPGNSVGESSSGCARAEGLISVQGTYKKQLKIHKQVGQMDASLIPSLPPSLLKKGGGGRQNVDAHWDLLCS